ncbi:hypothetical protein EX30DRAFT_307764 [Ascodesmis nigricans]|uniref:GPI-anchored cell wall organization protein Ecm33 n=1 Tax=Ascodesmis nigricans TaxID=341454 RepID=A0A4S2MUT6_9PEZI|nr:hypothetical protein EX30DRAFT_307764 [Ascodesmis nigricans]
MFSLRTLALMALAFSGAVNGAVCDSDFELESDGDISKLSSCRELKGSLVVGEKVTRVTLPQELQTIAKDLVIQSATDLIVIEGPSLKKIGGLFELRELIRLQQLTMPKLAEVGGIRWVTLPNLRELQFETGITKASDVYISDTLLQSLQGLNLTTANTFVVANNRYLKQVDLALKSVGDSLDINFNAKGIEASFPDLVWAMNVSLGDAGSISFPKLQKVNSSISFVNNTFEEASFPALKEVGESLSFISCTELTNLTAPKLESVYGTFMLANNTKLEEVKGFQSLKSVGGAIDLSGVFTEVELPALEDVRGTFNLQSTGELDCEPFNELDNSGVVQGGTFTCEGSKEVAESTEGGASTGGGKKKDDDKKGAAGTITANLALVAAAGAAVLFAL